MKTCGDFKILKKYINALGKNKNVKCIKANDFVKHIKEQIVNRDETPNYTE